VLGWFNIMVRIQSFVACLVIIVFQSACSGTVDSQPSAPEGDTWEPFASGFFQDHCTRCHVAGHSGGDFTRYVDVADKAELMRCGLADEVLDGCGETMPAPRSFPTGPRPPAEDVQRIITWIEAGLPRADALESTER
jgi:hypothetical protein